MGQSVGDSPYGLSRVIPLEKYWGRGGIPGSDADSDYQDMWVPGWAAAFPKTWRPHPESFSLWVNRECARWLGYFIGKNHTLGAVHAWFAAFLGVTRSSLNFIAQVHDSESEANLAISNLKFCMSLDLCTEDHDEFVDGIPSLPLNIKITTTKGLCKLLETDEYIQL